MEIVKVKFQSKTNKDEFSGREYSYFADIPLEVDDVVYVPTVNGRGIAKVTKTDVQAYQTGCPLGKMKRINARVEQENPEGSTQTDAKPEKGMRPLTIADTAGELPAPVF